MSAPHSSPEPRTLPIPGALNLRDLGGLPTVDGGVVRRGHVFRSEYPGYVETARDARELGIRVVIDLRRGHEAATECVDWAGCGVRWIRWPLSAGGESSWRAPYTAYLEHRPETVAGAVREVARASREGVLFHCAAGKDRTGIVAALLLCVLGVADADVVDDYLASAPSVEPVLSRLRGMELYAGMLGNATVEQQLPQRGLVRSLLEWLAARGGAEAWLVAQGVPARELEAFRRRMVEA